MRCPGAVFWGEVEKIAPLPDATVAFFNPDLKVYPTQIRIRGNDLGLRSGMSCRAEIVIEQLQDAVYVPVQSVVRVGGEQTVFVVNADNSVEPRPVKTGLDDNANIVIAEGLEAGERVSLTPPLENTGVRDTVSVDDLEGEAAAPATRPAEKEADSEPAEVVVGDFREAFAAMQQRATPAELKRVGELFRSNPGAARGYGATLMKKYNIRIEGQDSDGPATRPATRPASASGAADAE